MDRQHIPDPGMLHQTFTMLVMMLVGFFSIIQM